MERMAALATTLGILFCYGCCGDTGRQWEVTGQVLDPETSEPVPEGAVEVFFWFTVDGPGNRGAPAVVTDADGRFTARLDFTASCAPVLFGFFGSEAGNTSGAPRRLDVTVRTDDVETFTEFNTRFDDEVVVAYEEVEGLGIVGTIELPPVLLEVPP